MSLKTVIRELQVVLETHPIYAGGSETPVLLVCGAEGDTGTRPRCIKRLKQAYPDALVLRAEDCWSGKDGALDLAEFEEILVSISDCTILFPESPGSYAETGYFAAKASALGEKLLVASPLELQTRDSFLNRGPFRAINKVSRFHDCLWVGNNFEEIEVRLRERLPKSQEPLRELGDSEPSYRDLFYLTWLAIWLCQAIRDRDAQRLFSELIGPKHLSRVQRCLDILMSAGLISKEGWYYVASQTRGLPGSAKVDRMAWRSRVTSAITKHDPKVFEYLGRSQEPSQPIVALAEA